MITKIILSFVGIFILSSGKSQTIINYSSDSINNSLNKARNNGIQVEGEFIKLEKINERNYNLYLKLDSDSIVIFRSLLILEEDDIKLLKKKGNNIRLTYTEYKNPVTNSIDKIIQYLEPIYQ